MLDFSPGSTGYKKIGLFDSGVGGLTVLRRLTATLPGAQYVYFGDTARLPYGNRSRGEIGQFVREIMEFLSAFELDAVVMACNTSAALAHDVALQTARTISGRGRQLQVFNLIEPVAEQIAAGSFVRAGVMATRATVESNAFGLALDASNFKGENLAVACPKLVPLIESGRLGEADVEAALDAALREYLLALAGCDVIVLGCTHFPFVASRIAALVANELGSSFPAGVVILDPAIGIANLLGKHGAPDMVAEQSLRRGGVQIFTSGNASDFLRSAERCLGFNVGPVTSVALDANMFAPAVLVPPVFA